MNHLEFVVEPSGIPEDIGRLIGRMMKEHKALRVTVEPVRDVRSVGQNRLFSRYVRRLSHQSCMDFEEMKDLIKRHAVDMGYPVERDDEGNLMEDEAGLVPLASHKADVRQFAILIESCEDIAYEYGLSLD